jgi:hypothetical protein
MEDAGMFSKRDAERIANTVMAHERRGTKAPPVEMPVRPDNAVIKMCYSDDWWDLQEHKEVTEIFDIGGFTDSSYRKSRKIFVYNFHFTIPPRSIVLVMRFGGYNYVACLMNELNGARGWVPSGPPQYLTHQGNQDPDVIALGGAYFPPLRWVDVPPTSPPLNQIAGFDKSRPQVLLHGVNEEPYWAEQPW